MAAHGPTLYATGNIPQSSFVAVDPTADNSMKVCPAGGFPIGIASEAIFAAPLYDSSGNLIPANYAVQAGQSCRIYGVGDIVNLLADVSGFTAGDLLKSSANPVGAGKTTTSDGDYYGAIAMETTPAGCYGKVQVLIGQVS